MVCSSGQSLAKKELVACSVFLSVARTASRPYLGLRCLTSCVLDHISIWMNRPPPQGYGAYLQVSKVRQAQPRPYWGGCAARRADPWTDALEKDALLLGHVPNTDEAVRATLRKSAGGSRDDLHRHNLSHPVVSNDKSLELIGTAGNQIPGRQSPNKLSPLLRIDNHIPGILGDRLIV